MCMKLFDIEAPSPYSKEARQYKNEATSLSLEAFEAMKESMLAMLSMETWPREIHWFFLPICPGKWYGSILTKWVFSTTRQTWRYSHMLMQMAFDELTAIV